MKRPVDEARAEAKAARTRMLSTFGTVRYRLHPRTIVRRTAGSLRNEAGKAAGALADTVERRPGLVAGLFAAIGILFLQDPVRRALRRLKKEKDNG